MVPLAIRHWPGSGPWLIPGHDLLIAAVATAPSIDRNDARQRVRTALAAMLAPHLGCPSAAVSLASTPGQPLRLERAETAIGLSVSHEVGLSLAVAHLGGLVGIDLLQVPPNPGWRREMPLLARDYLGPELARRLATLPVLEQASFFAEHWTVHEASLKCLGMGLEEWTPALQHRLTGCRHFALRLPVGFVGAVVIPAGPSPVREGEGPAVVTSVSQ